MVKKKNQLIDERDDGVGKEGPLCPSCGRVGRQQPNGEWSCWCCSKVYAVGEPPCPECSSPGRPMPSGGLACDNEDCPVKVWQHPEGKR